MPEAQNGHWFETLDAGEQGNVMSIRRSEVAAFTEKSDGETQVLVSGRWLSIHATYAEFKAWVTKSPVWAQQ